MDNALKLIIVESVNPLYIQELSHQYTGFLGVTTHDIITHLLTQYRKITAADLDMNRKTMSEPYDPSLPIDVFFKRIDDAIQYADDGKVPFTKPQILQMVYHAVSASGMFQDACKEWRKRTALFQTWPLFKIFFAAEYHDQK